jgi:hypothetical protein
LFNKKLINGAYPGLYINSDEIKQCLFILISSKFFGSLEMALLLTSGFLLLVGLFLFTTTQILGNFLFLALRLK